MRENESKFYKIEVIIESEWEKERLEAWLRRKFPLTNHRIVSELGLAYREGAIRYENKS